MAKANSIFQSYIENDSTLLMAPKAGKRDPSLDSHIDYTRYK